MSKSENHDTAERAAILKMFIAGQQENTRNIAELTSVVREFIVEVGHTIKDVASLNRDIHGEGGIVDDIVDLKMDKKAAATRRWMAWTAFCAVLSFGAAWFIATR